MYQMKNAVILFLLFSAFQSFGQNKSKILKRMLFFHDIADSTRERIREVSLPESEYEVITSTLYFKGSKDIKQEYIKVDKDTFLFTTYDSLTYRPIIKGYVCASDSVIGIDTVIFNNYTYNIKTELGEIHYSFPSKHGFWQINEKDKILKGYYKNNKKTGFWYSDDDKKQDYREMIYRNDTLISEKQLNLAKSKNREDIENGLLGHWQMQETVIYNNDDFIGYEKNNKRISGFKTSLGYYKSGLIYEFLADNSIKITDDKTKNTLTGKWTLNPDFLIEITMSNTSKILLKLEYLRGDSISFKKL